MTYTAPAILGDRIGEPLISKMIYLAVPPPHLEGKKGPVCMNLHITGGVADESSHCLLGACVKISRRCGRTVDEEGGNPPQCFGCEVPGDMVTRKLLQG